MINHPVCRLNECRPHDDLAYPVGCKGCTTCVGNPRPYGPPPGRGVTGCRIKQIPRCVRNGCRINDKNPKCKGCTVCGPDRDSAVVPPKPGPKPKPKPGPKPKPKPGRCRVRPGECRARGCKVGERGIKCGGCTECVGKDGRWRRASDAADAADTPRPKPEPVKCRVKLGDCRKKSCAVRDSRAACAVCTECRGKDGKWRTVTPKPAAKPAAKPAVEKPRPVVKPARA